LVLPFWYQLTRVVAEKRPLNGCCVVVVVAIPTLSGTVNVKKISTLKNNGGKRCYREQRMLRKDTKFWSIRRGCIRS